MALAPASAIIVPMIGMNALNGHAQDGLDHLRQSITDILTTPVGSRVMRRDYGSRLFELIDQPGSGVNLMRIYSATVGALKRWEPRLLVQRVTSGVDASGVMQLTIDGVAMDTGDALSASVLLVVR